KYPYCIKILENLTTLAQQKGVAFSIKLTNTLEVINSKDVFPTGNQHSYLSGRPLHPLAVKLASKIQQIFSGDMDISFSAGIDAFNTYPLLKGNIKPLTVCSDLLKPGGYERLVQYITVLKEQMQKENISSIADLARPAIQRADYLDDYVRSSIHLYHKNNTPGNSIKNSRQLGLFDCISAPCQEGCATTQDIPTYLYLTGQKRFAEALKVIRSSNPLPNSTGMACDHLCQEQCTRVNYDRPLQIRRIKHFIANYEQQGEAMAPLRDLDIHVAIVGAGPSGLSAAYFLALEGFKVELFESNSQAGGMLSYAIPDFRLSKSEVELDIERVKKLGVKIHYDHKIADTKQFMDLYDRVNYIYLAMGAARSLDLNIPEEESAGCHDFLSFLKDVKQQNLKSLPNDAVIIGGGNSAIDAARTARRLMPPEHPPTLLYRRTIEQMPAYQEEIEDLLNEGVKVIQLAAPQEIITQNGKVTGIRCQKMSLNENPDRSGRYGVSPIPDSYFEIKTTFIVKAIGQGVIADFLPAKLSLQESADHPFQTSDPKIFMGGDLFRGGSSIIQAVADGKEVAYIISKQEGFTPYLEQLPTKEQSDVDFIQARSRRYPLPQTVSAPLTAPSDFLPTSTLISEEEAISEAKRCLYCDELCNQCVTVCPNRANISYQVDPDAADSPCQQRFQTLNIADFCNECGNCATFCPTAGAPYIDKPRLFLSKEAFELESKNAFYLQRVTSNKTKLFYKKDGKSVLLAKSSSQEWTYFNTIKTALLKDHDYLFEPYDND
ncbi:MAG: FAD-dependent oxidoreductase, partial [Bdellovibrionales bacterium]|nr:FAD-dependent oxidoreductase [Bdellovibrionales bacterium]